MHPRARRQHWQQATQVSSNDGNGTFTRITTGALVNDGGHSAGVIWGDYDNDGYLDLFVANRLGENNFLYHNEGDGTFSKIVDGPVVNDGGGSWACAWADIDNDGDLDLFVANGGADEATPPPPEPGFLYRNHGGTNTWLLVRLVGTASNRAAIGAKARVLATIGGKSSWQLREISGGSGWGSQNDLRAHFGLGDATNVTTLRIEWPSGIVQELQNVPAKQILTITEPAQLVPLGPREFQIRCWKGMRFEVQKSLNLQTWASLGTVTNETGNLTFQDTQGDPGACCFYRVVSR